jgi:hypothetical protein
MLPDTSLLRQPGRLRPLAAIAVVASLTGLLGACGSSGKSSSPTTAAPTTVAPTTTTPSSPTTAGSATSTTIPPTTLEPISVYFGRATSLGVVRRFAELKNLRIDALRDAMAGPSTAEKAEGITTAIPAGSAVEGYTVVHGVGYVDVNALFFGSAPVAEEQKRLAEIVYTLTAFPGIKSVQFLQHNFHIPTFGGVDIGSPVTRKSLLAAIRPVLLLVPAIGQRPGSLLTVSGLSAFNGILEIQVVGPAGQTLINSVATATDGETFTSSYPFPVTGGGDATVKIYASPTGGSTVLVATVSVPSRK